MESGHPNALRRRKSLSIYPAKQLALRLPSEKKLCNQRRASLLTDANRCKPARRRSSHSSLKTTDKTSSENCTFSTEPAADSSFLSKLAEYEQQIRTLNQQLQQRDTEIARLQALFPQNEAQFQVKLLEIQESWALKLLEEKIELRNNFLKKLEELSSRVDTVAPIVDVQTVIREAEAKARTATDRLKNEYELKVRVMRDRIEQLMQDKEDLLRKHGPQTDSRLCVRCKAFLTVTQGLDAAMARASSFLK